jgi:hypothetical protein
MMPVRQQCPSCGCWFIGSDAIGDVCPACKDNQDIIDIINNECSNGICSLDESDED